MQNWLLPLLFTALLFESCRDEVGEPLFNMTYPPRTFNLSAGLNPGLAQVISFPNIPSNYSNFLAASGRTDADVTKIVPRFARLISNDGLDFGYLTSISVRICPITQPECSIADEVFFRDDLFRRRLTTINLDPGLRNVKDLLSSGLHKLEVVFFLGEVSPYTVDCQLEYAFEAFR